MNIIEENFVGFGGWGGNATGIRLEILGVLRSKQIPNQTKFVFPQYLSSF